MKLHEFTSVATLAAMAWRLLASSVLTLVLSSSGAAQRGVQPDETQTAAARALFAEGVELAQADDHVAAADRFERALALRWAPPIAHNLALSLAQLGRYVEAIEHLRSVERAAEASDEMKAGAAERRLELEPRVGRLRVTLAPDGPGLEIRVDDRTLSEALRGMAFPVDPGEHIVLVYRAEQEVGRTSAMVVAGAEANAYVEVAVPTPTEVAAEEERQRADQDRVRTPFETRASRTKRRRLGGALGAVGAVVVGAIVVGLVVALRPEADPRVDGNFNPPRLQGQVEGVMP